MTKIAVVRLSDLQLVALAEEGDHAVTVPDGTTISPCQVGQVGETHRLSNFERDEADPSYLTRVQVQTKGTGYVSGNILDIAGGAGTAAQVKVNSIGSAGAVTSLTIEVAGQYDTLPPSMNSPSGGAGSGVQAILDFAVMPIIDSTYAYDAETDTVVESNVYQAPPIDNVASIEAQRQNTLTADNSNTNLKTKLASASAAEIDAWLIANVTNLSEARTVLGSIIKFLANKL